MIEKQKDAIINTSFIFFFGHQYLDKKDLKQNEEYFNIKNIQ